MMRVRTLGEQAKLSLLTPKDLRQSYSTEQERRQLVARKGVLTLSLKYPKCCPPRTRHHRRNSTCLQPFFPCTREGLAPLPDRG